MKFNIIYYFENFGHAMVASATATLVLYCLDDRFQSLIFLNIDHKMLTFCSRYCDICELTADTESKLQQDKIMEIGNERFAENCHKLRKGVRYSWATSVTLPGPEEFQRKYGGKIDQNIENALMNGVSNNVFARMIRKLVCYVIIPRQKLLAKTQLFNSDGEISETIQGSHY